jgi:hypothetical protein
LSSRILHNASLIIMLLFLTKENAMNENTKRRIDQFKTKIGYDSIAVKVDNSQAVVCRDFDPQKGDFLPELKSNFPLKEDIHIYDDGIEKEMRFDTGDNILYVKMFISSFGYKIAMEQLLNDALSTTLMVIPYETCPYDLGDINISLSGKDSYHIKWTFYNIYFSVAYSGKKVNVEQFCRNLQKYAESCVITDIERYRPRFDEVVVSSSAIKPGEELTIFIVPEYGKAFKDRKKGQPSSLRLEKIWTGNVLSLEKETDFFFRFKGIEEGTETITFILADTDALICAKHAVTITVSK